MHASPELEASGLRALVEATMRAGIPRKGRGEIVRAARGRGLTRLLGLKSGACQVSVSESWCELFRQHGQRGGTADPKLPARMMREPDDSASTDLRLKNRRNRLRSSR